MAKTLEMGVALVLAKTPERCDSHFGDVILTLGIVNITFD